MSTTRSSTKQLTEQEKSELERKLVQQRAMMEGEDYLQALPAYLLKLANEQISIAPANLPEKRKAWETVQMIAKLLKWQGTNQTAPTITTQLVEQIAESVGEQIRSTKGWVEDATTQLENVSMRFETMAEKFAALQDKIDAFDPQATARHTTLIENQFNEPGEIPPIPTYAQIAAARATDIVQQLQQPQHNAAIQAGSMNDRKFIVRAETDIDNDVTEAVLLQKATHALCEVLEAEGEEKTSRQIVAVQKMRGKGVICLMRTPAEMQWLKQGDRLKQFCQGWGATVTAHPSLYNVLVRFVPTNTPITPETYPRIEASSQLEDGSIATIVWAKKIENRKAQQKTAHAIVSFKTREAANQVIQNGLSMGGKWVYGHRDQKDPQRCMKCQQYGHIAKECRMDRDVCGRCGENHRTSECQATAENLYCAVCKCQGHTPADRKCPTLIRKIHDRAQRNPEAGYRLFVTNHPDTWVRDDSPNTDYNKDWQLEIQKGYNNRMNLVDGGNGRGRLAGGAYGEGGGTPSSPPPTQNRSQNQTSNEAETRPRTIDSYGWRARPRRSHSNQSQQPYYPPEIAERRTAGWAEYEEGMPQPNSQ